MVISNKYKKYFSNKPPSLLSPRRRSLGKNKPHRGLNREITVYVQKPSGSQDCYIYFINYSNRQVREFPVTLLLKNLGIEIGHVHDDVRRRYVTTTTRMLCSILVLIKYKTFGWIQIRYRQIILAKHLGIYCSHITPWNVIVQMTYCILLSQWV